MKLKKYKGQKNDDLSSKLKSYSALTGAFLLSAGAAQGQVIFTDINPDTLIQNSSFDIDLDNDGIKDFGINHYTTTYYHAERRVNLLPGVDPTNRPMAGLADFEFFSLYAPLNLPAGNPIGPGGPFYSFGLVFGRMLMAKGWMQQGTGLNFNWMERGPFVDSSGYIGVEFHRGGNTYYGWIECAIDTGVHGVVIKGFAYDATPNHYIIGGSGNTIGVPEQESAINSAATFYPNPVSNGKTFIHIEAKHSADLRIEIMNGMGQILRTEERRLNSGKNVIELDVNSLASGNYFVKFTNGENVFFRKVMVGE